MSAMASSYEPVASLAARCPAFLVILKYFLFICTLTNMEMMMMLLLVPVGQA